MKRCNICIEEECKGKRCCNCDTCDKKERCVKVLRPTIRITTKCTQACTHCCFECSPKKNDMMTVDMARQIVTFFKSNDIRIISIMGGEVCCNPDWREIVSLLLENVDYCRLVTNSDTVVERGAAKFLSGFTNLKVSVSKDRWHNNENVKRAVAALRRHKVRFDVATPERTTEESIVPVGRGELFHSMYSMFSCHCMNPDYRYAFLIDEIGRIYKCGFGSWNYAEVSEYVDGGFDERFKEFNQAFFKAFVPSCSSCIRAWERRKPR